MEPLGLTVTFVVAIFFASFLAQSTSGRSFRAELLYNDFTERAFLYVIHITADLNVLRKEWIFAHALHLFCNVLIDIGERVKLQMRGVFAGFGGQAEAHLFVRD